MAFEIKDGDTIEFLHFMEREFLTVFEIKDGDTIEFLHFMEGGSF